MTTSNPKQRAVALGFFDGLHLAHKAVLNAALEQKNNGRIPAVLFFDEHPFEALTGKRIDRLMTDEDRRVALLGMGFEILDVSFRKIKDLSPADFVDHLLREVYCCGFVSCGYNYTFGAGGKSNAETLKTLCTAQGIQTAICERIQLNGADICSSAIRNAIRQGEIRMAHKMLGDPFSFSSAVEHGDSRGAGLGFPTANQALPETLVLPKAGVYATMAQTEDGVMHPAVTNIGSRPTFLGKGIRSETFLLDYSGDLYGQTLRVFFHAFLREETTFPNPEALQKQIAHDAKQARDLLKVTQYS